MKENMKENESKYSHDIDINTSLKIILAPIYFSNIILAGKFSCRKSSFCFLQIKI